MREMPHHLSQKSAHVVSIGTEHKERLVNMFLRGESVADVSAFYACQRGTVEDVLREAIVGLARLNQRHTMVQEAANMPDLPIERVGEVLRSMNPNPTQLEPKVIIGHVDTETGPTEALSTPDEGKIA